MCGCQYFFSSSGSLRYAASEMMYSTPIELRVRAGAVEEDALEDVARAAALVADAVVMRDELELGIRLGHVDAADVQVVVPERPLLRVRGGAGRPDRGTDRYRTERAERPEQFASIHVSDSEW